MKLSLWFSLCWLLLSCSMLFAQQTEREKQAQAVVEALLRDDFAAVAKDFDETMTKVLPVEKLKAAWKEQVAPLGPYQQQLSTRPLKVDKYDVVMVTLTFAQGKLTARVVYNKDGK